MINKRLFWVFGILFLIALVCRVSAASNSTVCCEKTTSGFYCQDVSINECSSSVTNPPVPSACRSTSYCKAGTCYDPTEGTCLDNTPQIVCNSNGGIWSEKYPAQCELGCCVLGDQAAFVSLVRCKRLASFLGLEINFRKDLTDETQCILSVANQDKGACVYDFEFQKKCKFTTREECSKGFGNDTGVNGEFFKGKLCTSPEIGVNVSCGPTQQTTCLPGKDEVYFVDSCGNPANIYDSSKVKDPKYWNDIVSKTESCDPNSANANSDSCGNCNYLLGSICRQTERNDKPNYGDYKCANLNCAKTSNGNSYKHGESWCVYDDAGESGVGQNSVGSRFYKHICVNGEELVEPCDDFRQQECLQDTINVNGKTFSQAACRVNRWQDCLLQTNSLDCENSDKRDCYWKEGTDLMTIQQVAAQNGTEVTGVCLPKNPPGLKFWEGTDAQTVCSQANYQCIVTFEKGLFGGGETCKEGCECLTKEWEKLHADICSSLGDCGPQVNWIGESGYKSGYNVTTTKYKSEKN